MYKLLLCQRYLRTRFIALASIISVMLGVATMIVVNSVMSGFSTEMKDRIHGILADLVMETTSLDGVYNAEEHMRKIKEAAGDQIEAMSPTVEVYGMLSFQYVGEWFHKPVTIIGIDPNSKSKVSDITSHLANYQAVRNKQNQIVEPALRPLSHAPDWELESSAAEYRGMKAKYRELMRAESQEELMPGMTEPALPETEGKDDAGSDSLLDALSEESSKMKKEEEQNGPPVDPRQPLPTRAYVGVSLVSFLYEDHETGETRTQYMVHPGDDIKLSTVTSGRPPSAIHFPATVVDFFKSGMSEYDSNLVFVNLDQLQELRGMFDPQSGQFDPQTGKVDPKTCARAFTTIQIKLKKYSDAKAVVDRLRAVFPPGQYNIRTWEEKQGPLLAAVAVESAILNVLLFLIIAVAGFGILAIFYMIVVEKTRDIGILKALGASSSGVMTIFLSYGLALGMVGATVGVLVGLVFVWQINTIEHWLTKLTGVEVFDDRIYYFPEIPTHVEPMMVAWVAIGAIVIAVLASVLPARRAAQLHPVQALRYE